MNIQAKSNINGISTITHPGGIKNKNVAIKTNLPELRRIFWAVCCIVAGVCAIYFTKTIYYNCNKNALIVSIDTLPTAVEDIPFPAVTICNVNTVQRKIAEDILKHGTNAEKRMLEEICYRNSSTILQNDADDDWNERYTFMQKVHQPCEEMLKICKWRLTDVECSRLFTTTLTDQGLCCTFNQLPMNYILKHPLNTQIDTNWGKSLRDSYPIDDWNPEGGYSQSAPSNVFPFRSPGPGKSLGLTVTLNVDAKNYYCSTSSSIGFKVLLHNPAEIQRVAENAFSLPFGVEAEVLYTPQIKSASHELRSLPVERRRCYFTDEKQLEHYRTYTSANCKMECLASSMLEMCGCVFDFLPRNESVQVCRKSQGPCNADLEGRFWSDIYEMTYVKVSTNSKKSCTCYNGCSTLGYEKRMSYGVITGSFRLRDSFFSNLTEKYIATNIAILHVYFSDSQFSTFTTSVLCNFTTLIASTGGLFVLFIGFSILSIVEIFYYLTLNVLCKVLRITYNLDRK